MSYYVVYMLPVLWRPAVLAASGVVFRQIIAGPRYVVCNVMFKVVLCLISGGASPNLWWAGGSLLCLFSVSPGGLLVWGYFFI